MRPCAVRRVGLRRSQLCGRVSGPRDVFPPASFGWTTDAVRGPVGHVRPPPLFHLVERDRRGQVRNTPCPRCYPRSYGVEGQVGQHQACLAVPCQVTARGQDHAAARIAAPVRPDHWHANRVGGAREAGGDPRAGRGALPTGSPRGSPACEQRRAGLGRRVSDRDRCPWEAFSRSRGRGHRLPGGQRDLSLSRSREGVPWSDQAEPVRRDSRAPGARHREPAPPGQAR